MSKNADLYKQAKQIVLSNNNYSISFLQRKLQISYNKASELMQMIQKSEVKKETDSTKPTSKKITIIGIGGAGGNIISYMYDKGIKGVNLISINTDAKVLVYAKAHKRLQIGVVLTQGFGTSMCLDVGKEAAIESYEEIKTVLQGTGIVFLIAGLGGGTGSGATPVVAKIAKEMGIVVVCIVTKPFSFEGRKRVQITELGLVELKKYTNSLLVIPNDNLLPMIDRTLGLKESFELVDNTISEFIGNISEALYSSLDTDINLSFEDLQSVLKYKGISAIGVSEKSGKNAVEEAMGDAIEFPLFDDADISDAMCVLIILNIHPDYSYVGIEKVIDNIDKNKDISIIFTTLTDSSLALDYVKATVVATGFEKMINNAANNVYI
jgi:cell division protein FtsZ